MNPIAMLHRLWMFALLAAALATAQKYSGPMPAKPDLPYIKQAAELIPTEAAAAKSEKVRDATRVTIDGAASPVRTPLPLPIFILKADKLIPDRLQLFKLDVQDGHRQFTMGGPNPPDVLHMEITRLNADGLCRIAVSDPLDAGEYALTLDGSGTVFCFQVF